MVHKGRSSCIIRIILPLMLALFSALLPGCSKMTWTLGETGGIEEERLTQTTDKKGFGSFQGEEDLGEDSIPAGKGLGDRETAGSSKGPDLLSRPNDLRPELKKESGVEDIHFDFDKYTINDDYMEVLKGDAEWLSSNANIKVLIEGQADERGTTEYNLALSERRAQTVKKHLIILGIDPLRINTISYGEERPVCADHSEECWWKNRRAHFVINR